MAFRSDEQIDPVKVIRPEDFKEDIPVEEMDEHNTPKQPEEK